MKPDNDVFFMSFACSQEVLINILAYYGLLSNFFIIDIVKDGDYKALASRLQNFLICFEMFLAGMIFYYYK